MKSKIESDYNLKIPGDNSTSNQPPRGLKEITEKEFVQDGFFSYNPKYLESKQIYVDQRFLSVILFWMNDYTGFGISGNNSKGKITYFKFGPTNEEIVTEIKAEFKFAIVEDSGWSVNNQRLSKSLACNSILGFPRMRHYMLIDFSTFKMALGVLKFA